MSVTTSVGIRASQCLSRHDGTHTISNCDVLSKIKYLTQDLISNTWENTIKEELIKENIDERCY